MVKIIEQNTQILALLQKNELKKVPGILPADIPIKFPMDTLEHLDILENYLKEDEKLTNLVKKKYLLNILNTTYYVLKLFDFNIVFQTLYLATLGGKSTNTLTNKIMKFLYTDNLAKNFSFFGKRNNKKPFSECLLKTAVISKLLLLLYKSDF